MIVVMIATRMGVNLPDRQACNHQSPEQQQTGQMP